MPTLIEILRVAYALYMPLGTRPMSILTNFPKTPRWRRRGETGEKEAEGEQPTETTSRGERAEEDGSDRAASVYGVCN